MDLVTPLMQTLQANANLEHTESVTQDTRALANQRMLNTQIAGIKLQEMVNTRNVLMQAMQGWNPQSPGMEPSASDTPIQAAQKNASRLQQEANQQSDLAAKVMQGGGSPEYADKLRDNATNARWRAVQAQRELIAERQNQLKVIGGVAGAVRDDESAQMAYQKIADLDAPTARALALDRDTGGNIVYGPKTQRTFQTLANASMTQKEQLDNDAKLAGIAARTAAVEAREHAVLVQQQNADTRALQAQTLGELRTTQEALNKAKAANLANVKPQAVTKKQGQDAAAAVDSEFPNAEFAPGAKERLSADVADRANKIMAEFRSRGETIGLDDARDQALEELKGYVAPNTVSKPKTVFGIEYGKDKKTVSTYTRGGAEKNAASQDVQEGRDGKKYQFIGGPNGDRQDKANWKLIGG